MATNQVLIVPPYRPRGMIGLSLALGSLSGLLTIAAFSLPEPLSLLVAFWTFIVPPISFAAMMVRLTQKPGRVITLGAAYGIGLGITVLLPMMQPIMTGDTSHAATGWIEAVLVMVLAWGAVGAAFGLTARWVTRVAFFRAMEQTGSLCWTCGTDSPSGSKCPKCGNLFDSEHVRRGLLQKALNRGKRLGWSVTLLLAIAGSAWFVMQPSSRVADPKATDSLRALGPLVGTFVVTPTSTATPPGSPCFAAQTSLDPSNGISLLITYNENPAVGEPVMQLQVAKLFESKGPFGSTAAQTRFSFPRILCNLDRAQAEEVFRRGVPQTLKDALLNAASGASWNLPGGPATPPDVWIDPTSNFGKSTK